MVKTFRTILICVAPTLFLWCAHQIPPTGGPVDTMGPRLVSTTPLPGSVGHARRTRVEFAFSEWIDRASVKRAVHVFPPLTDQAVVHCNGNKVIINTGGMPFDDSTTYHIEISSELRDLHGNAFGAPYQLIFATGSKLDSGKLAGCVKDPYKAVLQPKVALLPADTADSILFTNPRYCVQTDSFGGFAFANIKKSPYRCAAFMDVNNNNRLDPSEQVYAPLLPLVNVDSQSALLPLYLSNADTMAARVASLTTLSPRNLLASWTRLPYLHQIPDSFFRISPADSLDKKTFTVHYEALPRSDRFLLTLDTTLSLGQYYLIYQPISPLRHTEPIKPDTLRFNAQTQADTSEIRLLRVIPTPGQVSANLKPRIAFVWSRPVRPDTTLPWIISDSLRDSIQLSVQVFLSDTTECLPNKRLRPGRTYALRLPDSAVSDISGNHPKDTAGFVVSIKTVSLENLGMSFSGQASSPGEKEACLPCDSRRIWQFTPLASTVPYTSIDSCGHFYFDSIGAGKGTMGYFVDENNDGMLTPGRLFPWVKPEIYDFFPDTLEARARWDITDVNLPACPACRRSRSAQP